MTRIRLVGAIGALASAALLAGCGGIEQGIDSMIGPSPSATIIEYPASVISGGTPMSEAGCQAFAGQNPLPVQCQPVPDGQAYLYVKTSAGEAGQNQYVPIDQFKATCTKDTMTVTGPGDVAVSFTRDARTVDVSIKGESVGSYEDQFLWWIEHNSVITDGASTLGDGTISISMRVTCDIPAPTKSPDPDQSPAAEPTTTDQPA